MSAQFPSKVCHSAVVSTTMNAIVVLVALCLLVVVTQAFVRVPAASGMVKAGALSQTSLMACRRNNKMEKRKRNREYARKFKSTTGGSRRKQVVEEKRLVVAKSEETFQAEVFKVTTDDDMPAYSGFDFI